MNTTDRETEQLQIRFKTRDDAQIELAGESIPVHLPQDDGELVISSDSAEQSIFQEDLAQILKEMEAELLLESEQPNCRSAAQECQERRGGLFSSLFLVLLMAMMGSACYRAVDSPLFGRFVEPSEFYQKKFGDNFHWLKK